jgi:hypothetical protein
LPELLTKLGHFELAFSKIDKKREVYI